MKLVTTEMTSLVERQSDDSHALGSLMEHILNTARRNIIAVKITLKTNLKQRKINSPLVTVTFYVHLMDPFFVHGGLDNFSHWMPRHSHQLRSRTGQYCNA